MGYTTEYNRVDNLTQQQVVPRFILDHHTPAQNVPSNTVPTPTSIAPLLPSVPAFQLQVHQESLQVVLRLQSITTVDLEVITRRQSTSTRSLSPSVSFERPRFEDLEAESRLQSIHTLRLGDITRYRRTTEHVTITQLHQLRSIRFQLPRLRLMVMVMVMVMLR